MLIILRVCCNVRVICLFTGEYFAIELAAHSIGVPVASNQIVSVK